MVKGRKAKNTAKKTVKNKNTGKIVRKSKAKPKLALGISPHGLFEQLRLSESYVSLVLGAIVVLVVSLTFFIFIKEGNSNNNVIPVSTSPSIVPTISKISQRTYIMLENETLWDVAVKFYGDGFRYQEIIDANKFENPNDVPTGTEIIIPNTK